MFDSTGAPVESKTVAVPEIVRCSSRPTRLTRTATPGEPGPPSPGKPDQIVARKRPPEPRHVPVNGGPAGEIDRRLHADRLGPSGPLTHVAPLASLPDGTIVEHDGAFWLVLDDCLRRWSFSGYAAARRRSDFPAAITVRTPRATVATLRTGYQPVLHPSAERS